MTTTQLFFALAGLMLTLFGLFAGFFKYYLDARIDGVNGKIDPLARQIDKLIDYMVLHQGDRTA